MKGKPNVDQFLDAGASAAAEARSKGTPAGAPAAAAAAVPDDKIAKTIRISKALNQVLKREAFEREQAEGRRVTESDLIDAALRQYLKLTR